jgi:hypothetical protein
LSAAQACHPSFVAVQLDADPAPVCRYNRIQLASLLPEKRDTSLHDAGVIIFAGPGLLGRESEMSLLSPTVVG